MTVSDDAILFNPFDPAFRADPYPFYDRLRAAEPVHVTPFGFTVLTRYHDIARTLRGAEFSRDIEAHSPEPTDPLRARTARALSSACRERPQREDHLEPRPARPHAPSVAW